MSINLAEINYPSLYRLVFLETDSIIDKSVNDDGSIKIWDFVNTVHIPPPSFAVSLNPKLLEIAQGGFKTTKITIKSINSFSSIQGITPSLIFTAPNSTNKIKPHFDPDRTNFGPGGLASSDLTLTIPANTSTGEYIVPIQAHISFPSEFFNNPTESVIQNLILTVIIEDPYTALSKQLKDWISDWFTPISGIIAELFCQLLVEF